MTIESIVASQRNFFNTNTTKDLSFRTESLEKLLEAIEENKESIYSALKEDLGKSKLLPIFLQKVMFLANHMVLL